MSAETDVCKTLAEYARDDGYTVYPECSSWDLVLVWEHDEPPKNSMRHPPSTQPGDQIAIEAKTRANVTALKQCISRTKASRQPKRGPDYVAVAAPTIGSDFSFVAKQLDICTISVDSLGERDSGTYRRTGHEPPPHISPSPARRMEFEQRLWTPPIVPDVEPGQSSPEALTRWRVKALKLCAMLRVRGWITRRDFDRLDINPQRWRDLGWIESSDESVRLENPSNGREYDYTKYKPGFNFGKMDFPDLGWEDERDRIVEADPSGIPSEVVEQITGQMALGVAS